MFRFMGAFGKEHPAGGRQRRGSMGFLALCNLFFPIAQPRFLFSFSAWWSARWFSDSIFARLAESYRSVWGHPHSDIGFQLYSSIPRWKEGERTARWRVRKFVGV